MKERDIKEAIGSIAVPDTLKEKIAARLECQRAFDSPESKIVLPAVRKGRTIALWIRRASTIAAMLVVVAVVSCFAFFIGDSNRRVSNADVGNSGGSVDGTKAESGSMNENENTDSLGSEDGKNATADRPSNSIILPPNGNYDEFYSLAGSSKMNGWNSNYVFGGQTSGNSIYLAGDAYGDYYVYSNIGRSNSGLQNDYSATAAATRGEVVGAVSTIILPIIGILLLAIIIVALRRRAEGKNIASYREFACTEQIDGDEVSDIEIGETLYIEDAADLSLPLRDERGVALESGGTYKVVGYDGDSGEYTVRRLV